MKALFDAVSTDCSKLTTKAYSTSFSLGILFLDKSIRNPIYSIYGFVRFADEIVDSFQGYNKAELLADFKAETHKALANKISLNPILNSFQHVVHQYNIRTEWIDTFLKSMEMDLHDHIYEKKLYEEYILGSAEVVGLMCLHVFVNGNSNLFEQLKPSAMKLGAAFQKVNFLRDIKADKETLGRSYFPDVDLNNFTQEQKEKIELEIENDFAQALQGIKQLPPVARKGVYLAYYYYYVLFKKIKRLPASQILKERVRIPNSQKLALMLTSSIRHSLQLL
jgi:phytoene synthase